MKAKLLVLVFSLAAMGCSSSGNITYEDPEALSEQLLTYQNLMEPGYLEKHLSVIAHDSLEGRDTGTEGLEKAAEYLIDQYEDIGLEPLGTEGDYRQPFDLIATREDSLTFRTYHKDTGELLDRSIASSEATGKFLKRMGGTIPIDEEIVFGGFGVEDYQRDIHQIDREDVQDKWVLVFEDIPHEEEGDTLVNPDYDDRARLVRLFSDRDAAGVLVIPQPDEEAFREAQEYSKSEFGEPSSLRLAYRDQDDGSSGLPKGYNTIHPELAAEILGLEGGVEELEDLRKQIKADMKGFRARSTDYALDFDPYSSNVTVEASNIIAIHEGSDPDLKNEAVILTSHYDHVGISEPDSTGDEIYNGADDDGSGTVAMLNIAQALSEAEDEGFAPRRSIIFLHVSAEELGLLGSRYYSDHPTFPIEQTVANLNMDMIGRIDEAYEEKGVDEYAYLIGGDIISSEMDSLIVAANERTGNIELDNRYNDLQDPNQFYRRSDHWNLGRLRVPFAFFFSGVHEDYHRPSDEVHKIEFEKLASIVRTIYGSAILIANEEDRPEVDNEEFIDITRSLAR
ncbi:MAG: M28 family peptidase [Balneolaceae bacterium]